METAEVFERIVFDEKRQSVFIRRMVILSIALHACAALFGAAVAPFFPDRSIPPVVVIELADLPPLVLPEEKQPARQVAMTRSADGSRPVPDTPASRGTAKAERSRRWMDRLDSTLAAGEEAPIAGKIARTDGLPVRRLGSGGPRPGDFGPLVSPEKGLGFGKRLAELETRVRGSGRIATGKDEDSAATFSHTGASAGEPVPPWIRDMIRKKVRGYLPELEAAYSAAIRRNPGLKGKLLVRFRIDSSGRIQAADSVESSFPDDAFVAGVLAKVRRWTFDPTAGLIVEVLYPFVFVAPS